MLRKSGVTPVIEWQVFRSRVDDRCMGGGSSTILRDLLVATRPITRRGFPSVLNLATDGNSSPGNNFIRGGQV